jgi:excisionase family DNA binding protein
MTNDAQEHPKLLKTSEVAAALRVTTATVRKIVARGDLKASRIGRTYRIETRDLYKYIADRSSP